ncbi:MAG: EamA family transporter [Nostocaceae cyanobacterium]|nr:EamA family transporter [Nostocaceae cyanobacterium]
MGRFENRSEYPRGGSDPFATAENALRAVTEELQIIQRGLLKSLQEDVKRLQAEKIRLGEDIQRLQNEKESLQQGRQIGELQALVRQLGEVMANHISSQLQASLEQFTAQMGLQENGTNPTPLQSSNNHFPNHTNDDNIEEFLSSLDDTITITFNSLQQEIKNYQNTLSQQLSRMRNQQLQGEEMLAELVNNLRQELEGVTAQTSTTAPISGSPTVLQPTEPPPISGSPTVLQPTEPPTVSGSPTVLQPTKLPPLSGSPTVLQPTEASPTTSSETFPDLEDTQDIENTTAQPANPPTVAPPVEVPTTTPQPQGNPPQSSSKIPSLWQQPKGLLLIVASVLVSCLYNVAIKVIFQPSSQILGTFAVEQLISPTIGNSLFVLMLRMLVVVPLMLLLSPILHPQIWQDLQYLANPQKENSTTEKNKVKQVFFLSIMSGCFLFLSQVLIYIAIGQLAIGGAITLFFIYPAISALLSWFLFRDRPTSFRTAATALIFVGELLVLGGSTISGAGYVLGSITAISGGIAFAFYVMLTRICAAKIHPVTFTVVNFITMLPLCILGLILPLPSNWNLQINPTNLLELILSAFLLGVLTLCGYLLNNLGISQLGASRASIFGATVPVVTLLFAWLIIQDTLLPLQILGVFLVTFGAATFSWEKMRHQAKPSKM